MNYVEWGILGNTMEKMGIIFFIGGLIVNGLDSLSKVIYNIESTREDVWEIKEFKDGFSVSVKQIMAEIEEEDAEMNRMMREIKEENDKEQKEMIEQVLATIEEKENQKKVVKINENITK